MFLKALIKLLNENNIKVQEFMETMETCQDNNEYAMQ